MTDKKIINIKNNIEKKCLEITYSNGMHMMLSYHVLTVMLDYFMNRSPIVEVNKKPAKVVPLDEDLPEGPLGDALEKYVETILERIANDSKEE